jgi:XTP/dITP diphosphohydrolase
MRPILLLATTNAGKRRELQALLGGLPLDLLTPADRQLSLDVAEDGADYAANASLKARAFAQASGLWTLADDTGLEVDALEGAPGLHSARVAASDGDRRQRLLDALAAQPRPWSARFRCVAALAGPDGSLDLAEGSCPGEIVPRARGEHGFGYDPIFLVAGTDRTMAELPMQEKNRLSHRARAIGSLLPVLRVRLGLDAPAPAG